MNKKQIMLAAAICAAAVILLTGSAMLKREPEYAYEHITVHYGDTLWSIAGEYCPEWMDKRDYIDYITADNGCTADILPGQHIGVRVYEEK